METPGVIKMNETLESNSTSNASLINEFSEQRRQVDREETPTSKDANIDNDQTSKSALKQKERYWSRPSVASDEEANRRQSKQDKEVLHLLNLI